MSWLMLASNFVTIQIRVDETTIINKINGNNGDLRALETH